MINPKYDPSNYIRHQAIPVTTDNQETKELFGSHLLMIKWSAVNIDRIVPKPDTNGKLKIHLSTPFGDLEPTEHTLRVSDHKKVYVQFLSIPQPDFKYQIEIIHPIGMKRSMLEIWEYIDPQSFLNPLNPMPSNNPYPQSVSGIVIDPNSINNIATGVTAGFTANIQNLAEATASAIDRSNDVNQSLSSYLKVQPWTGDIKQHLVVDSNLRRLEMTLRHTGHSGSGASQLKVSLAIGDDITNKSDIQFDDYLAYYDGIGGTWISTKSQAVQKVYAWVPAGSPDIVLLQLSESIHNQPSISAA